MRTYSGQSPRGSGGEREWFQWFTVRMKESIEYAMPALREYWLQVAASKFANPAWLHRFEENTEIVLKTEGDKTRIEFQFHEHLTAAFEFGWAPPHSKDFVDGLGTWTGSLHDMRDYLLAGGQSFRRVKLTNELGMLTHRYNPQTPLDYTIAKMQQAVTPPSHRQKGSRFWSLSSAYRGAPDDDVAHRQKRVQQILTQAARHRGRFNKNLDADLNHPAARANPGGGFARHLSSMMARPRRAPSSNAGGGGAMEVVRAISREVGRSDSWFTPGIEPGNTLEDTMAYAQQIVMDALARGKG